MQSGANRTNSQDVKDIKEKAIDIHAKLSEFQQQEVCKWLQSTDPSSLHYQACEKYEPGTGDWIFRSPEWNSWVEGQDRSVWISGIPGAGKTVLASHIIEQIKMLCRNENTPTKKTACVFYYCYFGHNQNEATAFLKWTVSQLCRKVDLVPPYLYQLYKDGCDPSLSDLLLVLEAIVQAYDRVYVVLDAIDESMPRNDLLGVLRDFATDSRFQNIRTLATSRQYIDIEEVMKVISVPVSMTNPLLDADIKLYVESQLRKHPKMRHWPTDLRQEVLEAVSSKAKGMFRWVVCQLDILQHLKPHSAIIKAALANLPETLDETYERIFLAIPKHFRVFVHQVLKWIHANRALCGLNISTSNLLHLVQKTSPELNLYGNQLSDGLELLQKVCGCLITVTQEYVDRRLVDPSPDGHIITTVSFAHYTVWEFLGSVRILYSRAAAFAVEKESTYLEFAKLLITESLNLESYRFLEFADLDDNCTETNLIVDCNFILYCTTCSTATLDIWGTRIARHDDIGTLVFDLMDPSKPHYEKFVRALNMMGFRIYYPTFTYFDSMWQFDWSTEPDLVSAKIILNLLVTDRSFELAKLFLQKTNAKDMVQSNINLAFNVISSSGHFGGSIIQLCQRAGTGELQELEFLPPFGDYLARYITN